MTLNEIADQGDAFYDSHLKEKVEPLYRGQFLILDIDSGDYEIDRVDVEAEQRIVARRPGGTLYTIRVGSDTAYFLGGGSQ